MKIDRLAAALCMGLAAMSATASSPEAYAVFDGQGRRVEFSDMVDGIASADVVFFGENHNCPIAHWMEHAVASELFSRHGASLTIGEEMMEADNQLILDEYMSGAISYDRFEAEARLWPNYSTDYYPVVYFAKENKIPFVATNVPRRYAAAVREKGIACLDSLADAAKACIAPLPVAFEFDGEEAAGKFGAMLMMRGGSMDDARRLAEAQAVKDATMAWFIARNLRGHFLHINGSMHSDNREGIIPYLQAYRPATSVAVVTTVRQEDISALDDIYTGRADYFIAVPETMTTTY